MKEAIEKFWNIIEKLDSFKTPEEVYQFLLTINQDAANRFKESNFDYELYLSKYPNGFSFLTEPLRPYFDNPDFLKEFKFKENGIYLQDARAFFPQDMFLKICDYYEKNYDDPYQAFYVETQADYEFLLSRGLSNEEILKIDKNSLPFMFDKLLEENYDFSELIKFYEENGPVWSKIGREKHGSVELMLKMLQNKTYLLLRAYIKYYDFEELAPSFFEAVANSDIPDDSRIQRLYTIIDYDIDPYYVVNIDISTIKKFKSKYGNKIIKYVKDPTDEVVDLFPDLTYGEYIRCKNLNKNEKLFNRFFEEGYRDLVITTNFSDFSDESIIELINKLSDEELRNYSATMTLGFKPALRRALTYSIKKNDLDLVRRIVENPAIKIKHNFLNDESLLDDISIIKTIDKELFITIFKVLNVDMQAKMIKEDNSLIDYCDYFKYIGEKISDCFLSKIPWEIIDLCVNDKHSLIKRYDEIVSFIEKNGIDIDKFNQYAMSNTQDWVSQILFIIDNGESNFLKFNEYFKSGVVNYPAIVDSFLILLDNYSKYPELCSDIISQNRPLTEEEINQIMFLFGRTEKIDEELKPKSIKDCSNFFDNLIMYYQEQQLLVNTNPENLSSSKLLNKQKELLCTLLFNCSLSACEDRLKIFGNTEELRKMIFNDKGKSGIELNIREVMILTSMIEDIIYCKDLDSLKQLFSNCLDNFDLVINCSKYFTNYEKHMTKLYEKETKTMLTSISSIVDKDKIIDEEASKKLGRTVYDFSDKKYILLAHVKSNKESVEELVTGVPKEGHNFISLSPIGNRNQLYYTWPNLIFVYDTIPDGSFIRSSRENIGSNGKVRKNSTEIETIGDEQRGIVETSQGLDGVHPETFCFREGIKPVGIAVPIDRELNDEEKTVLEQYPDLVVIRTQGIGKRIESPKTIETVEEENKKDEELEKLKQLKSKLFEIKKKTPRRIAIFTDSHGLFEPTLAILEDARRQGITEIYSLGDNIGSGPNPGEVIDLLDEYGVKSVVGNHELYLTEGVDKFSQHLRGSARLEAENNRSWTEGRLTDKQIEKIKQMPKKIEIEIGGKKVLLTHYTKDYNTYEDVVNPNDYDEVFQGHEHFEIEKENVSTLRGAGIGYRGSDSSKPTASYIILEEQPDGGYKVIPRKISFDIKNLDQSITESSMGEHDEKKIAGWSRAR